MAAAGQVPELLVLGSEPATGSGLGERRCRWERPGAPPQDLEVVVQVEVFAAPMDPSCMGSNGGAFRDDVRQRRDCERSVAD